MFIDTEGRQYRWPLADADPPAATALADAFGSGGRASAVEGPYVETRETTRALLWWRVPRTPLSQNQRRRLGPAEERVLEHRVAWPIAEQGNTVTVMEVASGRLVEIDVGEVGVERAGGNRGWRNTGWLVADSFRWLSEPAEDASVFLQWLTADTWGL